MKIQVISDIHLEHYDSIPPKLLDISTITAPYLFLVGDIGIPKAKKSLWLEYIKWCAANYSYVFYVLGNHESYGFSYEETIQYIRKVFNTTTPNCTLLENGIITQLEDYTVIGCTLWTDIDFSTAILMNDCKHILKPYVSNLSPHINKVHIDIQILREWYKRDKEWLETTLNTLQTDPRRNKKIIVATHHLPSMKLIPPKFQNHHDMKYAKGFASNLDHIIPLCNLWLFGHTHHHVDMPLDTTRCYANPRGYPSETEGVAFENGLIELA